MNPQHEYIISVFGNPRIRSSKEHYWQKEPLTIQEWSKMSESCVIARVTEPNEIIIDVGDELLSEHELKNKVITIEQARELYPKLREEAKQVKSFLDVYNIPYWIGFQGRGFHFHVFVKGCVGKVFKNQFIYWLKHKSGINDVCEDVNNKDCVAIREFGSQHERCFFTARKCLLNLVPDNYPMKEVQAEDYNFNYPKNKVEWVIPQDVLNEIQLIKTPVRQSNEYFKKVLFKGVIA